MFTPNRALRCFSAILLCLSVIFLVGDAAYPDTGTVTFLPEELQGILPGSGPTEIYALDASADADDTELSWLSVWVINEGEDDSEGLFETLEEDFLAVELWADTANDFSGGRTGIFDAPGGDYAPDSFVWREFVTPSPTPSPGPLAGYGFSLSISIPPGTPGAGIPTETDGDFEGDDFFFVVRTSLVMDSDPIDEAGVDRADDFYFLIFEFQVEYSSGESFPAEGTETESSVVRCEALALDMRPDPNDRIIPASWDNRHPGHGFPAPDFPNLEQRYEYAIFGQNLRPRFRGERDLPFSGFSVDTFEAFFLATGFEQPVIETLERRQSVIGLDIAGGTTANLEAMTGITLTLTNLGESRPSNIEFDPRWDLDELRSRQYTGTGDIDPFFSGIGIFMDGAENDGIYTEPLWLDEANFIIDPDTGDQPLDFFEIGEGVPDLTFPNIIRFSGEYVPNTALTHYMLPLRFNFTDNPPIDLISDDVADFFVVMRPDSGFLDDDSPYVGDGVPINYGADFKISLERTEDGDFDGLVDPSRSDYNADGLAQPAPVTFRIADPFDTNFVGDIPAGPEDHLAILASKPSLDSDFREARALGAVVKAQDLSFDWGFDVNLSFDGQWPRPRIPQRIDATSAPTALLGLNIATSDVPQLDLVDRPVTIDEIRLDFSGEGFEPEDIEEILLIRDDKSPFFPTSLDAIIEEDPDQDVTNVRRIPDRSIGVFDLFNDMLHLPIPEQFDGDINPREVTPVPLHDYSWEQDGPNAYHVVLKPSIAPRVYPHDEVESEEFIDLVEEDDNYEIIESPNNPLETDPRDIVFSGADYFLAIRTSADIGYNDRITMDIPRGGLVLSNGPTTIDTTEDIFNPETPRGRIATHPITGEPLLRLPDVDSVWANVPVELTSLVQEGRSLNGQSGHTPVIGINMYTNQPPASQGGVDVHFEQLIVAFLQFGARDDGLNILGDLLTFVDMNGQDTLNSGIQLYRDADGNGRFSATEDTLVTFDDPVYPEFQNPSMFSVTGDEYQQVLMVFSSDENRQLVPPTDTGADAGDDFFVVIRPSQDMDMERDNFSVAIISWGPDSPSAFWDWDYSTRLRPNELVFKGDPLAKEMNKFQAYGATRRGIGFVDSNGVRTRSNEMLNTGTFNATNATWLDPVDDLEHEFVVDTFPAFQVLLSWTDSNGNLKEDETINEPNEDGYIVEFDAFGQWFPILGSPFGEEFKDDEDIFVVPFSGPPNLSGRTITFRVYPFTESLIPSQDPPFNGPGPIVQISVLFSESPLPQGEGGGGGGCFVATAAYGSDSAEDVLVLRQFRDRYLLENAVGRAFVKTYYKLSPPIASFIADRPLLRRAVRTGLAPTVAFAGMSLAATEPERAFLWAMFAVMVLSAVAFTVRKPGGATARRRSE